MFWNWSLVIVCGLYFGYSLMTTGQYITVREAAQNLGITEKKVMDLIEEGKLQAYRIADQFLRLKKSEVLAMRNTGDVVQEAVHYAYTGPEKIKDFLYFNDFYILASFVIAGLLYAIWLGS